MADIGPDRQFEDIRVLILEDNPADAELLEYELRGAGLVFTSRHVADRQSYTEALAEFRPDIILSDYELPSMNGWEALQIRKEICPETPFLLVTGAVGEERAIEILTSGATDYVLKRNLSRLLPGIKRALHESYEHRKRKEAEAQRDVLLKSLEQRVQERTQELQSEIAYRKRAESALRESEERFRVAQEVSPDGFTILKPVRDGRGRVVDFTWVYQNPTIARITGNSPGKLTDRRLLDILPGHRGTRIFETYVQVAETGEPAVIEEVYEGEKIKKIWFRLVVVPMKNTIAVLAQDITERKKIDEALIKSEGHLRALVMASSEVIYRVSPDWSEMRRLHGRGFLADTEEANPNWMREYIPSEAHPFVTEAFQKAIRAKSAFELEHPVNRADGSPGWTFSRAIPIMNSAGKIIEWLGAASDITARKQAEKNMESHTAELETTNEELDSFSYSVSHDLRAPLRAIYGFLTILLKTADEKLTTEERRQFDVIRDNATKMNQLIDGLLILSRLGRAEMTRTKLDMKKLAESVWEQQLQADPETPYLDLRELPEAFGDNALVRQVLSNLVNNAVKYTRKRRKPLIEIGGDIKNGETIYYVKDNGIGFDMKYYDKLFGVFQRLHSETEFEGTGIGLSIVQRIIRRHGGRVWAEGKVGKGATFYFSLPAGDEKKDRTRSADAALD